MATSTLQRLQIQKPLVVVVGFLGAQPRYVKKYADLVASCPLNLHPLVDPQARSFLSPHTAAGAATAAAFANVPTTSASHASSAKTTHEHGHGSSSHTFTSLPMPPHAPTHAEVLSYLPSTFNILSKNLIEESTRNLHNLIQSHCKIMPNRPLIFYLLSNNGAYNYAYLLHHLRSKDPNSYDRYVLHSLNGCL